MPRKKATEKKADATEVSSKTYTTSASKAQEPEMSTAEKLKARIAAGEPLIVLVTDTGLHLTYNKPDTPENRTEAVRLCNNTPGKSLKFTFLNDEVSKS